VRWAGFGNLGPLLVAHLALGSHSQNGPPSGSLVGTHIFKAMNWGGHFFRRK
jgi:hypothetical protein